MKFEFHTEVGRHRKSWTALVTALALPPEDNPEARDPYTYLLGAPTFNLETSFESSYIHRGSS